MCRWLLYQGEPVYIETYITKPQNSLINQSQRASEAKTEINGDGLGIGWYGNRRNPGLYRDILPAWSDCNLKNLCQQIESGLFFAHVRASTGTLTTRSNCHPFVHGHWMFMHNGQIGDFAKVRRRTEALINDDFYNHRLGTTDSEAIFYAMLSEGIDNNPVSGTLKVLQKIVRIMHESGASPFRFTSALSNGETVFCFRFSSDQHAPSLYSYQAESGIVIASEPFDSERKRWQLIPENSVAIIQNQQLFVHTLPDSLMETNLSDFTLSDVGLQPEVNDTLINKINPDVSGKKESISFTENKRSQNYAGHNPL